MNTQLKSSVCFIVILIFLILPPGDTFSQGSNDMTRQLIESLWGDRVQNYFLQYFDYEPDALYSGVEGSPFLFDQFVEASIRLPNDEVSNVMLMNFDILKNLIAVRGEGKFLAIETAQIQSIEFYIGGKTHKYVKGYTARGLEQHNFVRIMSEGSIELLYKPEVTLIEDIDSYDSATKRSEIRYSDQYFISKDGETDRMRRFGRRRVFRLFENYKDELETFTDANNLDLDDGEHVGRLISHYNSLVDQGNASQ